MRTHESARLASLLGSALVVKEAAVDPRRSEAAVRAWDTRGRAKEVTGEVFAAGLRNFKGSFSEAKHEHSSNPVIRKLDSDFGKAGNDFAPEVLQGEAVGKAVITEKEQAVGAWYETGSDGKKLAVTEPSIYSVIKGDEDEINRRAAGLGKKYGQQAVAVAINDPDGPGRIFTVDFDKTLVGDAEMEAITQHVLDAGLGGATGLVSHPSFRFIATGADEAKQIQDVLGSLPKEYGAVVTQIPARIRFLSDSEYDGIISGKAAEDKPEVTAHLFIGGLSPRVKGVG